MPEPKTNKIEIPYSDGSIDITEATGEVFYSDRENISFSFVLYDGDFTKWSKAIHDLSNAIHGKKVKVILDNDPKFYYMMRLKVSTEKSKKPLSTIVLEGMAEPFKYAIKKAGDPWEWDEFSFVNGVILKLENQVITNGGTILLSTDSIYTVPEFVVTESTNLRLIYGGASYPMLSAGTYYFPQVRIGHETLNLNFNGSGKLSIIFRGRYL